MPFKKGHIPWNKELKGVQVPWNKGLTKETDERVKRYGEKGAKSRNWKGKTYEEIYGIDRTLEIKKSQPKARKGEPHPVPWLKGVPRTEEVKRKISDAQKGEKHQFFGQHHSVETKRKMSKALKEKHTSPKTEFKKGHQGYWLGKQGPWLGKHHTEGTRKKISETLTGKHPTEKTRTKMSETQKRIGNCPPRWPKGKRHTEEAKRRMLEALVRARKEGKYGRKPTAPEKKFMEICAKHNLSFKYVGDGRREGWVGNMNPDFIEVNNKKIAVEILGDYWHNEAKFPKKQKFEEKKKMFAKHGWTVIGIWERELKQLPEKEIVKRVLDQTKPVITPAS